MLNDSNNENSKFATKKWYVIDNISKGNYLPNNEVTFLTSSLESRFCDYSDPYILVTGNIAVTVDTKVCDKVDTKVAFKNWAPLEKFRTEINETFVDDTQHINIAMPIYNLIEYSNNYSDTSGSLWQFQRDQIEGDLNLAVDDTHIPNNLSSFKYKSSFITNRNGLKIAVPPKYFSHFRRSLEVPLINCKIDLLLKWYENCILSSVGTDAHFAITDTKFYVPVGTLKIEDNAKLLKLLSEGFKRLVYWNIYHAILTDFAENSYIRERLNASFQEVSTLFVLPYVHDNDITNENSYRNYFLPRLEKKNDNIEIDGRNFYDQSTNDLIKQKDEVRKN